MSKRPGMAPQEPANACARSLASGPVDALLASAGAGTWEWDLATGETRWSDGLWKLYGLREPTVRPTFADWLGVVHPEDRARVEDEVRTTAASGTSAEVEYRVIHPDGSIRWLASRGSPVRDARGAITCYVGLVLDVTERARAQEALRESETRFRDVVASAGEYVFEMDPTGALTYVSEAVEAILGYRPEEIVGRNSLELMDAEEQARSGAFLQGVVARREPISHFSQTALHRDGRTVRLEISAVPRIDRQGALLGYRGAVMDVTHRHDAEVERERLRSQLAHAQRMEVVGRLAGGVAHDFNNLLTVILACGLDLRDRMKAGEPGDPEAVEDLLAAGQRAADLTRQLLSFARRQVVAPERVDLNAVVLDARKLLGRVIGEDVKVVLDLDDRLWAVRCDPGLLGQVVMNLAVNARDAMPAGGSLTLATTNLELRAGDPRPDPEMPPGRHVCLRVRDSGVGMSAEVLERAFEPFFSTKPVGVGTGLGLSTVYGNVKQSGGFVVVRSAPGAGTTFEIYLPADAGEERPAVPEPDRPAVGTERVLVVEDDARVRAIVVRTLRAAGYAVLEAGSGEEAVALARQCTSPIHLLLTDVVMPGMGGREVARAVTAHSPATRVLFVSGYSHDAISRQGVLDEGIHFLPKPFTTQALGTRVRAVLDAPRAATGRPGRSAAGAPAPPTTGPGSARPAP